MSELECFPFSPKYFAQELKLSDLQIVLAPEYGSLAESHRLAIRQRIASHLKLDSTVLDLSKVPSQREYGLSISHTRRMGGYAYSLNPSPIGFDLELTDRIKTSALGRISRYESEMSQAPSADFLWTAKEASFKCLSADNPEVLKTSGTRVQEWSELEPGLFRYHATSPRTAGLPLTCTGLAWRWKEFTLALASAPSLS